MTSARRPNSLTAGAVPVSGMPAFVQTHGAQGSGAGPVGKPVGGSGTYFPPTAKK